jgi:hypothetical protein
MRNRVYMQWRQTQGSMIQGSKKGSHSSGATRALGSICLTLNLSCHNTASPYQQLVEGAQSSETMSQTLRVSRWSWRKIGGQHSRHRGWHD